MSYRINLSKTALGGSLYPPEPSQGELQSPSSTGMGDLRAAEAQPEVLGPPGPPPEQTPEQLHPTLWKLTSPLRTVFDNPWAQRVGQTGAENMTMTNNPNKVSTGSKFGDISADVLGFMAGAAENPASVGSKVLKGTDTLAARYLPTISNKVADLALKGAAQSVPYDVTFGALNGGVSPGQVGVNALGSAGLNILAHGAGRALANKADSPFLPNIGGIEKKIENAAEQIDAGQISGNLDNQQQRARFNTGIKDYQINNAVDFTGGRGFNSLPESGLPRVNTQQSAAYARYTLDEAAKGNIPLSAANWLRSQRQSLPTLKTPDTVKTAMDELQQGIETAQNYLGHNDIYAAYPPGTSVETAMTDIKAKTGVDLLKLMSNVEAAQNRPGLRQQLQGKTEVTRLGQVAGAIPEVKGLKRGGYEGLYPPGKINTPKPIPTRLPGEPWQGFVSTPKPFTGQPRMSKLPPQIPQSLMPTGTNGILGPGSISAAKIQTPEKMSPTGNKNEYVQSFNVSALNSPSVNRGTRDLLWWDVQPGEQGTYQRLNLNKLSDRAQKFIDENPEKAYQHAISQETLANDPALSAAIGIRLAEHYQKLGKYDLADNMLNNTADILTKAGQTANVSKILDRLSPAGLLKTVNKNIKNLNEEGAKLYGGKWKEVSLTPEEHQAIANVKPGDSKSRDNVFEQIQTRIANELPSTAMEKVNAWRHMAMLLNPKTQIRNVAGNVIMMGMRRTAKQVSAILQKSFLKPEVRTQVFNIKEEYQQAANDYYEANKRALLGTNKYKENISLNMPDKRVFKNNALEATLKTTYKLMELGDIPFFKNAYVNRLASYAQAKGINDFSMLPQEAFDTAQREAEQATYKDASALASFLNKVKNPAANATLGQKATAFLTEAALPFTKTPINIIKRGIQYSPAGVINGLHMWKTKKLAAEGIDELAKGLTGTAIMGLGYLLASKGILTGKASNDKDLKAYDANTGNYPFSVLGKFSYDWAQPFSVPLSVGVEIWNALKNNPAEAKKMGNVVANNDTPRLMQIAMTVSSGIYDSLAASGDTVFNMSVMKGIKNLIGNPQGFTAGLAQLPQSYATQFIPAVLGQVAGFADPTVRQTYVPGNMLESMKLSALSKIPFASKSLPAKQTPFGEDVSRPRNPVLRGFSQFLSPGIISVSQNINPAIDTELRRLNKDGGLTTQFPTMVQNYIEGTQKHPRINLTPEETVQYQKRTGQLTQASFDKIMKSGAYINARDNTAKNKTADEMRADMLAKAIADAKAQAKQEIVKSKGYRQ